MLDIYLTRHGTTSAGEAVLGGQIDVPLSDDGRREAEALAERLEGVAFDRILSSPMSRALETAEIVARGRPIEVDERLRELDYGRWEGLETAEIGPRDPELRARWERDPAATHAPGGECGNDVAARVREFLAALIADEIDARAAVADRVPGPDGDRAEREDRRVLVSAHGTLDRILLCVALNAPVGDYRRRFVVDRASLSIVRYEPGDGPRDAQLVLLNEVGYLRAGEQPRVSS